MSLAGVRGAITLAGVLTLPLALNDGSPFPAPDLAIFLAMGVIFVSLITASFGLPLLLLGLKYRRSLLARWKKIWRGWLRPRPQSPKLSVSSTRFSAGRVDAYVYLAAAARVMDFYRTRIEARSHRGEAAALARGSEEAERKMRLAAVKAERTVIFAMLRSQQIGSETADKLVTELDLLEARYEEAGAS